MEFSPLGGRAGAAPYTLDSWQPAPSWAPVEQSSKLNPAPVMELPTERRAQGPSWPLMFALACGFALLMSALTIVGAGWLREQPQAVAVATPAAAGAPAPAAVAKPALEVPADPQAAVEEPGLVINPDEVPDPTRSKPKATNGTAAKPSGGKKELTAAQKEMLARMGANTGTDLSKLGTGAGEKQAVRPGGSLTPAEMLQVVTRGKPNLTRCYETALRGSGSTDTVRLDVEVSVSPSGNVTSVKTSGQGLPGMNNCIERTVKMWRFPASGEAAATRFPLLFQPGA
jgi:hypothetical protein